MNSNTSVDVVVIGAGISGLLAAWHLLERGAGSVTVLERDDVASGTTAAGAGFLGLWAHGYLPGWDDDELEVEQYGLDFYAALAERGHDMDYRNNGHMWLATDDAAFDEHVAHILRNGRDPGRARLSPAEVSTISGGLVRDEAIADAVYFPTGAQVTAAKAARAVASEVRDRGGRVLTRHPVSEITTAGGRVTGVQTQHGHIAASTVVLAAGAWSNGLVRPLGTWIPQVPLTLTRLMTEPQDDVVSTMPGTFIPECHGLWFREHRGGLLWGCAYQNDVRYRFADDVPDRFDVIPLDPLFEILDVGREAASVVPALTRRFSLMLAQGLPCYTADSRGLVGRVPGVDGLYFSGGDNESGVGHGPGQARILADAVVSGGDSAVEAFRLDRFDDMASTADIVRSMREHTSTYFT